MTYGQLPPESDAWHFPCRLRRVVDGDTLDLTCDMGFQTYRDVRVRLYGVDTGEIYGVKKGSAEYERGATHKQFVEDWFAERDTDDWSFRVYTLRQTGKYGRYVADVVGPDGDSLVAALHDEFGDEVADD